MNETRGKVEAGSLVTGCILIGIGILFLLDRFDYLHFGYFVRTWWPMALVIIGLGVALPIVGSVLGWLKVI